MSTQDGWGPLDGWNRWDGWSRWDGWNATYGGSQESTNLALALTRTRERLVFGPPDPINHPKDWPGPVRTSTMLRVSPSVRIQNAAMDVLVGLRVKERGGQIVVDQYFGAPKRRHYFDKPTEAEYANDLKVVEARATLRDERAAEIFSQLRFNPAFWSVILPLNSQSTPRTLELMQTVVVIGSIIVQRSKAGLNLPRPHELSPRVQPLITVPEYSAYPGGHATESLLVAYVLEDLLRSTINPAQPPAKETMKWLQMAADMMQQLASRIADNRVVAGVHFTLDSAAGFGLANFLRPVLQRATLPEVGALGNAFANLWRSAQAEWEL